MGERRFDRRLGVDTRGLLYHGAADDSRHVDANCYQGVPPENFERMLRSLPVEPGRFCFVDLGCGKGKALLLAADAGFCRVVGVELSTELADVARSNLSNRIGTGGVPEYQVIAGDAAGSPLPPEPLVVFLFNPFGEQTLSAVLDNLRESLADAPRPAFVAFMNPTLAHLLDGQDFLTLRVGEPKFRIYEAQATAAARRKGP